MHMNCVRPTLRAIVDYMPNIIRSSEMVEER